MSDIDELLTDTFSELNELMARAYRALAQKRSALFGDDSSNEPQWREKALRVIREDICEGQPLRHHKTAHLEFLVLLIAAWQALEIQSSPGPTRSYRSDPLQ